jgi:serine O-acetyltransferase
VSTDRSKSDTRDTSEASLAFIRSCVETTPLRAELARFDAECESGDVHAAIGEGHDAFQSDLDRWSLQFETPELLFELLRFHLNLQATYFYRVSHALWQREIKWVPDVIGTVSKQLTGLEIYYSAKIGPGLKIIHGVGAVIGAMCTVGSQFTIYQGATIGDKLGRDTGKRPVIGDQVIATVGSQILGPVTVGSQSVIAANAVVLESVPERCVAAGVPARVVVKNLSDEAFGEYWASIKG